MNYSEKDTNSIIETIHKTDEELIVDFIALTKKSYDVLVQELQQTISCMTLLANKVNKLEEQIELLIVKIKLYEKTNFDS